MKIKVFIPYENAEIFYKIWAHEEEKIDFENDKTRAERCTVAYAAEELCTYLSKMGFPTCVGGVAADVSIRLEFVQDTESDFSIECVGNEVLFKSSSARGLLYASYELLEFLGVRWYTATEEYVPKLDSFTFPESKSYKYDMQDGRGYHFEGLMKESRKMIIWMARNRMNLLMAHPHSTALQKKLGFVFKIGGHVFHTLLNPNNLDSEGRRYIDAHRDYYGKRSEDITEENAMSVQFCVTNPELLDLLADTVIDKVKGDWREADSLELAGFDTWGKSCECESCARLGGGSDRTLHFLSYIRKRLNEAYSAGVIAKNPKICFDVYEGTDTMEPPKNPVPKNLLDFGDYGIFCPILRCYKHALNDGGCEKNSHYAKALSGWVNSGMKLGMNEYYDVSKFEDLPIIFKNTMKTDIPYYIDSGISEMVYMHVPMTELGVRTLNEYLYARFMRDKSSDAEKISAEYFEHLFAGFAKRAAALYERVENAGALISSYRAWDEENVLYKLMSWSGKKPDKEFPEIPHLGKEALKTCYQISEEFAEIADGFREIKRDFISCGSVSGTKLGRAVNPSDVMAYLARDPFIMRINEDVRGAKYASDVFRLTALMLDYYESLYEERSDSEDLLKEITIQGEKMSEYTFGVSYAAHLPEIEVRDALMRSQLSGLYYRILTGLNKEE